MAEIIPREFIELLLAKIDLVDLIHPQVPLRKKSGSNYFARCPFHNEKTGSFSVSQTKQFYYCFGCGAHGNAIDFVMQFDRLNFPEAIETLARSAGLEVPKRSSSKNYDSMQSLYELMNLTTDYYIEELRKTTYAVDYLKARGISGEIAQRFRLGYAPPGWNHLIDQFTNLPDAKKKLLDTGLVIKKSDSDYYDRFRDRIMFPIQDHRGQVIGFGGRILEQGEPKYLNSPETILFQKGQELYGLYHALRAHRQLKRLLIVEGYMDVIALYQAGITYAAATLGTATTEQHIKRLYRYTSQIIFCFDGDQAGKTAAWRALEVMLPIMEDSISVHFLFLPDNEDPDSLVRKEGKVDFEKRIDAALSLSDFLFQTLAQQCDIEQIEGRARFAVLAMQHIKKLPPTFFQSLLIDELSKRARIPIQELKTQIKPTQHVETNDAVKNRVKIPAPLRLLMALLVQKPKLAQLIEEPLVLDTIPGGHFFNELLNKILENPAITTAVLIEYWRGEKQEELITKLAQWDHMIPDNGIDEEFIGAIRQVNLLCIDEKINALLVKAAQNELKDEEKVALTAWITKKKQYSARKEA